MWVSFIKSVIRFLWRHFPYLVMDVAIPTGHHVHRNPSPKKIHLVAKEVDKAYDFGGQI
jgi:hypothetical protein